MIKNLESGLATSIEMAVLLKQPREIYIKDHFIYQGKNGIAFKYWKNI